MSLVEYVERVAECVERGTAGHLLAQLLGLADAESPYLAAVMRRLGGPEMVAAAERRLALSAFVDGVLKRPREEWHGAFVEASQHHGSLMALSLGSLALRELRGRSTASRALVRAARDCAGPDGVEGLDLEIRLLLDAVDAVAMRLGELEPRRAPSGFEAIEQGLEGLSASIHPDVAADVWGLCALDRRLGGSTEGALAALRHALAWAKNVEDHLRTAEYRLEEGLVLALAGRYDEACEADARALEALRGMRGGRLIVRGLLQRVEHLLDAGRVSKAAEVVGTWFTALGESRRATALRLRGRLTATQGDAAVAELLLGLALETAEMDGDAPERALVGLERMALFDEAHRWEDRLQALRDWEEGLAACPHVPPQIAGLPSKLAETPRGEGWDSGVVQCIRLRLREWQVQEDPGIHVPVM